MRRAHIPLAVLTIVLLAPRPVQMMMHVQSDSRPSACLIREGIPSPAGACAPHHYRFVDARICSRVNRGLDPWDSPCVQPRNRFLAGEIVHLWVQVDNIGVGHRLRVDTYRNGRLVRHHEGRWAYPVHRQPTVHLFASEANTIPGHYRFEFGLQTPDGFEPLGSREFSIGVRSPVHGSLRLQCDWPLEPSVWSFCQHRPQGNHAASGMAGADDDNAWDINLRDFLDTRRPVFAVAPGRVVRYGGVMLPGGGRSAGVLIEHHTPAGERWWSGYLHMRRDSISVREDDSVDTDTFLGRIGRSGTEDNHLHFVVYDGVNDVGGLRSLDVEVRPREDPWPLQRKQIARRLLRHLPVRRVSYPLARLAGPRSPGHRLIKSARSRAPAREFAVRP